MTWDPMAPSDEWDRSRYASMARAQNRDANDDFVQHGPESVRAAIGRARAMDADGNTLDDLRSVLPLVDPASWHGTETPERQWAWHEYIPTKQATYLTGPGSAGKSLLAQQLCTCIAAGLPFLGVETRQSVAIYLTCEDDEDELHRRQKAICEALGVDLRQLSGKLHLVSLSGAINSELLTIGDDGAPEPTKLYRTLESMMQLTGAGFVGLDNVAHLFGGNENIRHEVANFVALLNRLAIRTGSSVLFLGHPNKAGQDFSGSTAWENQVRSRLYMAAPADENGMLLDPDMRHLTRGKANYARNGEKLEFHWHKWAFTLLDDLPPNISQEIRSIAAANGENDMFLKCLAKATEEKRAVSHNPGSNYAPKVFAGMPIGKGMDQRAYHRAMERLLNIGVIALDQPLWRGPNRVMKQGIKLLEKCTDPPASTPCTDLHETRRNPARFNPPISKDINGAATGAAAPLPDSPAEPDLSRPRFPADDDSDLDEQPYRSGGWG